MILILKAKYGDYPVYARDDDECKRAYLHLFHLMDGWNYYCNLDPGGDQIDWYNDAKTGDAKAAERLLNLRSDLGKCRYEYETIETVYPVTP